MHFKGFINNVPCSIDSKFLDQTVDFGEISRNELTTGTYRTDSKTFNIELKNCDTTTYKTAQIQFTAPTVELKDGTATSKYVGLGSIQNAGIALTDSGGKAIELGSRFPAEKYTLNGGRDQITPLNFAAYVKVTSLQLPVNRLLPVTSIPRLTSRFSINNRIVTE